MSAPVLLYHYDELYTVNFYHFHKNIGVCFSYPAYRYISLLFSHHDKYVSDTPLLFVYLLMTKCCSIYLVKQNQNPHAYKYHRNFLINVSIKAARLQMSQNISRKSILRKKH
jgi:hypothetical protein